jgi:hypothetical protein
VKLLSLGWDTLIAYLPTKYGIEATKTIPIQITELNNDCPFDCEVNVQPEFKVYNKNREAKDDFQFEIGKGNTKPRVVVLLNTDSVLSSKVNAKIISVTFSIPNILLYPETKTLKILDLPSTWKVKDTIYKTDANLKINRISVILESDVPLTFTKSIRLFQLDFSVVIPANGYVDSILSENYKVEVSDVEIDFPGSCINVDTAITSPINIKYICADNVRMLVLSQYKFSAELYENVIEYSVGIDWNTNVTIYNTLGQAIKTIDSGNIKAGDYEFDLDLLDVPSGVYFFELNAIGLYRKVIGVVKR